MRIGALLRKKEHGHNRKRFKGDIEKNEIRYRWITERR